MPSGNSGTPSYRSLPILPNVLAALNEARKKCKELNHRFVTPHILLALLELPDSEAAICFDQTRPGLAEEWRYLLRVYMERALKGDFGEFPDFLEFEWDHRRDSGLGLQLAWLDGQPAVDELYLLLGILENRGRSKTRRELEEYLGTEDFDQLRQITSERARARDLGSLLPPP